MASNSGGGGGGIGDGCMKEANELLGSSGSGGVLGIGGVGDPSGGGDEVKSREPRPGLYFEDNNFVQNNWG